MPEETEDVNEFLPPEFLTEEERLRRYGELMARAIRRYMAKQDALAAPATPPATQPAPPKQMNALPSNQQTMKMLKVHFEDDEFKRLEKAKGDRTWHDFILLLVKEVEA